MIVSGLMADTVELSEAKRALLAKYLRGDLPQAAAGPPPVTRRAPGSPAPLSFAQQRLWFLAQVHPAQPVYNLAVPLQLAGELNRDALEQSLSEIVRRH